MERIEENRLLSRWATLLPRAPEQVGRVHETDAELLPLGDGRLLALTVDTLDEEIRAGLYVDPFTVGRMAAVAALSDLAAVAADPLGLLLSVGLPPYDADTVQERLALGVSEACRDAGTFVLGGDTNEAASLVVGCTAAGVVPADCALGRVGARPGDVVFASGPLGSGAARAASALLGVRAPGCSEGEWMPRPRLAEARELRGLASACMDTSDGLVATLDQIARLNRVSVRITRPLESLLHPSAIAMRSRLPLPAFAFLATPHGEYEIVFTVAADRVDRLEASAASIGWRPVVVGRVEGGTGLFVGERPVDGARVRNLLSETGHDVRAYVQELCRLEP